MPKEIKLRISLDGKNAVVSGIGEIADGLSEMDKIDARNAKKTLDSIDHTTFNRVKSEVGGLKQAFASFTGNLLADAIANITSKLYEGSKAIFTYKSNLQSTAIGFSSLIGNTKDASKLLADIQQLARKSPFEFEGLAELGQRLLGAKVELKQITPLIKDIGNIVAATGKATQDRIEGVTIAISQMISKTKVSAEEMEQLSERGIPAWQILSEYIGKSVAETRKLSEQGKISSDVMVAALQKISREKFGNAMEQQTKVGLTSITKIKDFLMQAAATYFDPLYQRITEMSNRMAKDIEKQGNSFRGIGNTIAKYIGEGLALGVELIVATFANYLGTRLREIFTEGKFIDPITHSFTKSFIDSLLKGAGLMRKSAVEISQQNAQSFPKPIDYSRPQDVKKSIPLNTAELTEDAEKLRKEREALAKADLAAQISLYQNQLSEIERIYKEKFDQISDILKETNSPTQFQASFDELKQWYGSQITDLIPAWEELVKKQTLSEKKGQYERLEVYEQVQKRKQELTDNTLKMEDDAAKLLRDFSKRVDEDQIKSAEDKVRRLSELADREVQTRIRASELSVQIGKKTELQSIEEVNNLNLKALEAKRNGYQQLLNLAKGNKDKEVEFSHQISLLDFEITQQKIQNAKNVSDYQIKEKQKLIEAERNYNSTISDLDNEIQRLNVDLGLSAELSKADATAKMLQTEAYKNLTPEMKATIQAKAEEIDKLKAAKDAQEEYRRAFEQTADIFEDALTKLSEGNWKGFFDGILQEMKRFLIRAAAEWLASKFFKLISNTGSSGTQGNGGFNFGNILGSIKQVLGIGGNGGFRTPSYNPSSSGNFFSNNPAGLSQIQPTLRQIWDVPNSGLNSSGGNSFFSSGIFAPQKNILTGKTSALAGTLGGIGGIMSLVGGFIPGKVGGVLSMAGTGMQIGAMFGPWGVLAGGIIGGLAGLFGGDPKRKRDKNEKMPQLEKGFADALNQLRQLGANKDAFFNDPEGTIAKAMELRTQIASGFGIQMESKKYSRIAQDQIKRKLAEADIIIADLNKLKDRALLARDVDTRLQTRFAGGVYISPEFRRRNGMLRGTYNGTDTLPSILAMGEMVLNPMQIQRVRANAGFDVFKGAGIPGYAGGTYVQPSSPTFAPIGNSPQIVFQPNITIVVEGEGITDAQIKNVVIEGLKSSDVQVEVVKAYDKAKLRTNSN